ncbi:MAG: putative LPS assembly protein LptD [Bacteroidales bacterium]
MSENKDSLTIDSTYTDTLIHIPKDSTQKSSQAIDAEVHYSSQDSIIFNVSTKHVSSYGDAKVTYESIELESYYINLDLSKSEIFAKGIIDSTHEKTGTPTYVDNTNTFDSDSIKYNFTTKKGLVYDVVTQEDEAYLHGKTTKIYPNEEIHIHKGKYTTCDADHPHFYVYITKGKLIPNDKIIFGPAWLILDEIPLPLVIPFGFFPNKKGRTNGILIPKVGEEASKGFYFRDMGVYLGFSDYVDLRLTADLYTLGSWRTNLTSHYKKRYSFDGNISLSYSSLVHDEERQAPQFNVRWSHSQNPKSMNGGNFSANVNYGSVGFARQNTLNDEEFLNNRISSSVSYSKQFSGTPFGISSSVLHNQNNLDSTISLTLPQLNWNMNSITPFATQNSKQRFYNKITVSYNGEMQNKLTNAKLDSNFYSQQTLNDFQKAFNHRIPIQTSFNIFNYFTVSPSFNFQERWYFDKIIKEWSNEKMVVRGSDTTYGGVTERKKQDFNRVSNYSTGISVRTMIYGMYQFRSKYLRAIRHIITPSISYSMTRDFSEKYYKTYQTNSEGDRASYSYIEHGIYGIPNNQKQNALSFKINNDVEAKIRDTKDTVTGFRKISLIKNLSISGNYNFAADSLKMSYISMSGNTKLFDRFNIKYSASFDPYTLIYDSPEEKNLIRSNNYMLDKYGQLWRKRNEKWQTSFNYKFGPIPEKETLPKTTDFDYWDVPWNINVSYSVSIPRKYYYNEFNKIDSISNNVVQTMGINGKFSLTKNWNISFRTGWDFTEQAISYTSIDVYRDLHCWEMSFNWVPLGDRQRWDFTLRVKADMLKDLKLDMQSSTQYF